MIREKIIAQRKELGYTQKHLAGLAGVRKERISEFETGKGNTGIQLVEKLMKVLNLTISQLRSEQLKGDYTLKFIEWKNKYFIYEQKTYDFKSINKRDEYTLRDLHRMYRRAMLESPFN